MSLFQPYVDFSKDKEKKEDDGDEEKQKSIFERENVFRKPYEEKEWATRWSKTLVLQNLWT